MNTFGLVFCIVLIVCLTGLIIWNAYRLIRSIVVNVRHKQMKIKEVRSGSPRRKGIVEMCFAGLSSEVP